MTCHIHLIAEGSGKYLQFNTKIRPRYNFSIFVDYKGEKKSNPPTKKNRTKQKKTNKNTTPETNQPTANTQLQTFLPQSLLWLSSDFPISVNFLFYFVDECCYLFDYKVA